MSLRQTFILTYETDPVPIMFHMPLSTCFEACSPGDAGRVLVNITKPDLPEDFWRRFYNIGGGPEARGRYFEFIQASLGINGLKIEDVYERQWFALRNFHCQWYEDAYILNEYLDFQQEGLDAHLDEMNDRASGFNKFVTGIIPKSIQ